MSSLFRSIVSSSSRAGRSTASSLLVAKRYRYHIVHDGPKPPSYDSAWKDIPYNPTGDYSKHTARTTEPYIPPGADAEQVRRAEKERREKVANTPAVLDLEKKFTPFTRRAGLLARKRGMTCLWDEDGKRWPVTILQVEQCQVVHTRPPHPNKPHFHGIQIGAKDKDWDKVTRGMQAHYGSKGNGVVPKYRLREFQVTEDAVLPVGTYLSAAHFVPGQYVDVRGKTIGKGFQGVMKRWGFRGLPASHGTTKTHRSGGAIGANQDPGKVWKGKKMAGHMGNRFRTTQNLLVHRVDTALNLIYVRGHVPGMDDAYIEVKDAVRNVRYKAGNRFLQGKDSGEWLDEGVETLPMPGVSLTDVEKADWPEILEWPGYGKEPTVRG